MRTLTSSSSRIRVAAVRAARMRSAQCPTLGPSLGLTLTLGTLLMGAVALPGAAGALPAAAGALPAAAGALPASAGIRPAAAVAQDERPDSVVTLQRGSAVPVSGKVLEDTLEGVLIETRGKERRFEAAEVLRVELNSVSDAYLEGRGLARAGLPLEAAEAYLRASEDTEASAVAQASAKLRAAEVLCRAGAADDQAFARAAELAAAFQTEFPSARELPTARLLEARALRLAGRAGEAAAKYAALFGEANGDQTTPGYGLETCYGAGLGAAYSQLDAGDPSAARMAFSKLDADLTGVLAGLEADDPRRARLAEISAQTDLAEGWVLLAGDKATQAKSYFQNQLDSAGTAAPIVATLARLGIAQSAQAADQQRAAQFAFAEASANAAPLDDVVAAAMLGLAETTLALDDPDARTTARVLLEEIVARYPASTSLSAANALLADL